MRQLIRTYSITGQHQITITGYTFTKQDIRLILDETLASNATTDAELLASVLVSSTKKGNVVSVLNGVITLDSSTAILTNGDDLTIEIDIDNGAKESTSQTILNEIGNLEEIIEAINGDSVDDIVNDYLDGEADEIIGIIGNWNEN